MSTIVSTSPQHPEDVVGEWPDPGIDGAERAIAAARVAAEGWRRTTAHERGGALHAAAGRLESRADELIDLVIREVGKPVAEARGELARTVAILRFYAQAALDPEGDVLPPSTTGTLLYTRRRPRGVVGLITPWNFPLAIPAWKLAPALAYGNVVILKPSPMATAGAFALASAFELPDAVLQIVPGDAEVGRRLASGDGVDAISFTGSVAVGREVTRAAADAGIPAQAEMGGQNPAIVLADADVRASATIIAGAAMGYAGQKCTATRRVIAVGDEDAVREAFVDAVGALRVGDPADPATTVGPVITAQARDRILAAVERAKEAGGRIIDGAPTPDEGWYVPPTVVTGLTERDELAQHEVFGPVTTILHARDVDDAVRIANCTTYGLVAAVYTRDLGLAIDVADRLDVGMVRINAPTTGVDFHAPFGGEKDSSVGPREQGRAAREFYTSISTVTVFPP
ncbi:MAG: aldehyde dehydrogenase family protein [Actinomycetota bacterium]